jgi:hypothetical protein
VKWEARGGWGDRCLLHARAAQVTNPFAQEELFEVRIDDPFSELHLVTDPDEWRYLRQVRCGALRCGAVVVCSAPIGPGIHASACAAYSVPGFLTLRLPCSQALPLSCGGGPDGPTPVRSFDDATFSASNQLLIMGRVRWPDCFATALRLLLAVGSVMQPGARCCFGCAAVPAWS